MFYTTTIGFRILCRLVLFCFTFASFHPASLRVPWTLNFAQWTFDFGPTPAYGKAQDRLPVVTSNTRSRKMAKLNQSGLPAPMVRLPGHVLPALAQAKAVAVQSKAVSKKSLTLTLVLKRDDQAGFERYLQDVYDPSSPDYRQFLTRSELSDRFGPSQEAYDDVLSYLQSNGFTLVEGATNRMTITVRGARAQVDRTFGLHIRDYRIGGRTFYANDRDPAFPKQLSSHVIALSGLNNLAGPKRSNKEQSLQLVETTCTLVHGIELEEFFISLTAAVLGIAPPVGLAAIVFFILTFIALEIFCLVSADLVTQVKKSPYDHPSGAPDGTGQKIGLLEFDAFRTSDVSDYINLFKQAKETVGSIGNLSQVHVNGGVATPGANQVEVLLDIAATMTIAPGAKVAVYDAPFTGQATSYSALFNKMINDRVTVISNSWASCEDQVSLADVQGIDTVLQTAAALGISVFNATGDSGSTCLDGSPNTVSVPADSPNATAVGGTSLKVGTGNTYGSETWWDGSQATQPTGQGGFGVSKFFTRPSYQTGLNASAMRSIPDVVIAADPANGALLCEADKGGCPDGLLHGGTSLAAPIWAAFTALLNQAQGHNLGTVNPLLYPLAATDAFHNASSMSSDFAHVGLGSPNLNILNRLLSGQPLGLPDASKSQAVSLLVAAPNAIYVQFDNGVAKDVGVPADGVSKNGVLVRLVDANGNIVSGKTVTLTANGGSAVVTPSSGVTTVANGSVAFEVTDLKPETVTFTATDVTDGIVLQQKASVTFVTSPATGASIAPPALTVTANGIDKATIAVTLKDALNRPTPGKIITLSQGNGHSLITGPNPSVTDSNGQITFAATNLVNEVVTYTAVDVSDGNLPVPGNTKVTFTNGSGGACGQNTPPPMGLNGYTVTPFATGFTVGPLFFGNITFDGCSGVLTPAFLNGSVYVPNFFNGDLFKLGAGGGAISNANKLTTIGPTLGWPVVGKDGRLYAIRVATHVSPPNFTDGAILELDPNTGTVLRTVAANLPCSQGLVVDPLSGDLFFDDECFGAGFDARIFRVRNPGSANPTVETYATLPFVTNGQIVFSPKGTLYVVSNYNQQSPPVIRVSGTNGPNPPTVTQLPGVVSNYWLNIGNVDATGEAKTLITLQNGKLQLTDITTNPPTITATLTDNIGGGIIGPDGCLYMPNSNALYKLTDPTGGCSFVATNATPSISLTPTAVSPNPAQGTSQTFTATFRNIPVPADLPVLFLVNGANPQFKLVHTGGNGQASFSYTAISQGKDTIVATATVNNIALTSNKAQVTWVAGKHVTFLTLNPSPTAGTPGQVVTVMASLTDSSVIPIAPILGQAVTFTLGSAQCVGTTNSKGIASCALVPSVAGAGTLTANFAGTAQFVASSDTVGFNVIARLVQAAPPGDLTCNGDVDLNDVNLLNLNLNKTTSQSSCGRTTCNTTCDLDGDGKITALDARKLVTLCTRPRCAVR